MGEERQDDDGEVRAECSSTIPTGNPAIRRDLRCPHGPEALRPRLTTGLPICDGGQLIGIAERIQLSASRHSECSNSEGRRQGKYLVRNSIQVICHRAQRLTAPVRVCAEDGGSRGVCKYVHFFPSTKYFHGMHATAYFRGLHHEGRSARTRDCANRSSIRYNTPRSAVVRMTLPAACTTFCKPGYR